MIQIKCPEVHWLIDWCFMPTLAIFQLYCGIQRFNYEVHWYSKIPLKCPSHERLEAIFSLQKEWPYNWGITVLTLLLYSSTKLPRASRNLLSGLILQFILYTVQGASYLYISFLLPGGGAGGAGRAHIFTPG